MENIQAQRNFTVSLAALFGLYVLSTIVFTIVGSKLNASMSLAVSVVFNVLYMVAIGYCAFNSKIFSSPVGQIAAIGFVAMQVVIIGKKIAESPQFNLFTQFGVYVTLTVSFIICVALLGLFATMVFSTETWRPLALVGSLAFVPSLLTNICQFVFYTVQPSMSIELLVNLLQTFSIISSILNLASFVLAVISLQRISKQVDILRATQG